LAPVVLVVLYVPWLAAAYATSFGMRFDVPAATGILMILAACSLWTAAPLLLRADKHMTTWPDTLITTGLYGKVRHPLYAGHVLLMNGIILVAPVNLILLETPLLWLLAYIVARYEEKTRLEPRFGQTFQAYKNRVPMLLPAWGWVLWMLAYMRACIAFIPPS